MTLTPEQVQANRDAVKASGDRTIMQYQNWMKTNAAAHLMRSANQIGITGLLRERQHTLDEICQTLSLDSQTTALLLGGLVAIGIVEQYEDDFALARAGHLLCQYDEDLGDAQWQTLPQRIKQPIKSSGSESDTVDLAGYQFRQAATQWIHTSAAIQLAEILDIGGENSPQGIAVLDLGCGSAVWSCAIAHRDAESTVVAIDQASCLKAARQTADSIELGDRFRTIESEATLATVADDSFDLVVLAQQLSLVSDEQARGLIKKSALALRAGGRLVIPDLYIGPGTIGLGEAIGRLQVRLGTPDGRVRDLRECQQMLVDAGFSDIQFTYLAASEQGLGMLVATVGV